MEIEKYIFSIGAGKNQVILINEIKKLGFKCISCDIDENAPGKKLSDIFINISSYNYVELLKKLNELNINLVGVLTRSTGNPIVTVSKIAESQGLVALDSSIASILIDKKIFIEKMHELNIPAPILYSNIKDIKQSELPIFIKPSKTNISHAGMKKCESFNQLQDAYYKASDISKNSKVNMEEYLKGEDIVSIDFVFKSEIINVATIGEISTGEPYFDGIGWYSIERSSEEEKIVGDVFKQIKRGLDINYGFFQSAMKVNLAKKIAKVYEIHAEIGGDLVNDVFIPKITNGYNIFKNSIYMSINQRIEIIRNEIKPAVLIFKEKINQYNLCYNHELVETKEENNSYVICYFKSFNDLKIYLMELSREDNFSINNN